MNKAVFRLLDANLNRAREGLRVIEDTARFVLNQPRAAAAARGLRHRLDQVARSQYGVLLAARDSLQDPGFRNPERRYPRLEAVLAANFRRAQEALRVLEEYGRLLSPQAVSEFKGIRFQLYTWEKRLLRQS